MAKTKFYDATIFSGDVTEYISVDMTALPYGKFNSEHPLLIKSDVVMENGKKKPLPDFSNVIIMGSFDCSSYTINADSKLPKGITELVCLHSVNGLDVLTKVVPSSVRKLVVRTAILNNIKRNLDNALKIAQNFIEKHPYIIVTDGKSVLSDVLKQLAAEQVVVPVEKEKSAPVQIQVERKTEAWLSMDELVCAYKQDKDALSDISDEDIQRAIRIARKDLNRRELMRADGAIINCVHQDDLPALVIAINQQQKRDSMQRNNVQKKEVTQKTEQVAKKTVEQSSVAKFFVGNKEVQETAINKYIKNNVWKEIQKHCKNDLDRQLEFLESIEVINIKPVDTAGKKVCYIQDGILKTSPTVTFKNIQWLSQGFSTLDDRARIIWCMNEHGFIATEYFEEHEKKQAVDYKKAIRQKEVSGFTLDDTVSVSSLIAELTAERAAKQSAVVEDVTPEPAPVPEQTAGQPVVTEPKKRARTTNKAETVPVKVARKRIPMSVASAKVTTVSPESDKVKNQVSVLSSVAAPEPKMSSDVPSDVIKWNDYDSLHASFTVRLQGLNTVQSDLLQRLSHEINTDTALEYTQQLQDVLHKKQNCEKALEKLNALHQELQKLKQEYSNQI